MRRISKASAVLIALVFLLGCHTITEDLPATPTNGTPTMVGLPVLVTPVTVPTPSNPTPSSSPTPAATPTPSSPTPGATPTPTPTPTPDTPQGGAVASVSARVFFSECGTEIVPDATEAQVGCRVHYDSTPKDSSRRLTTANNISWWFSNTSLVTINEKNAYMPVATVLRAGVLEAEVTMDGVRSNRVTIRLTP
jgi:hypothetical protein